MNPRRQLAALRRDLAAQLKAMKAGIRRVHRTNAARNPKHRKASTLIRWIEYDKLRKIVAADQERARNAARDRLIGRGLAFTSGLIRDTRGRS